MATVPFADGLLRERFHVPRAGANRVHNLLSQFCVTHSEVTLPETLSARPSKAFFGGQPVRKKYFISSVLGLALYLGVAPTSWSQSSSGSSQLPDAPQPDSAVVAEHNPAKPALQPHNSALSAILSAEPCEVKNAGATMAATASVRAVAVSGLNAVAPNAGATAVTTTLCVPHVPVVNWYARFLNGPEVKELTPEQKAYLAAHNLLDPFNLITIGGEAAISVAANSHSAYGPGIPGWGRYVGVSFTQDMTGEFFGTFLIPSLVHQDPHYHREPNATIKRRIAHATLQVLWTQADDGHGMVNYANIAGFAIDDAIGDLYVPGLQTRFSASASRYGIVLATAPIANYITEFVPDLARHIHIQIVVIQRVINQFARTDNGAP